MKEGRQRTDVGVCHWRGGAGEKQVPPTPSGLLWKTPSRSKELLGSFSKTQATLPVWGPPQCLAHTRCRVNVLARWMSTWAAAAGPSGSGTPRGAARCLWFHSVQQVTRHPLSLRNHAPGWVGTRAQRQQRQGSVGVAMKELSPEDTGGCQQLKWARTH